MGLTGMTVGKWRKRYREQGLEGLHNELRPGRPRTYEDDTVAEVINRALQTRLPDGSTHWSPLSGCCHWDLQDHGSPLAADLLGATPPPENRTIAEA